MAPLRCAGGPLRVPGRLQRLPDARRIARHATEPAAGHSQDERLWHGPRATSFVLASNHPASPAASLSTLLAKRSDSGGLYLKSFGVIGIQPAPHKAGDLA